jgi:hypothetical protein
MTCGLAPERVIAMRAELERNKASSVETSIDDAVAEKRRVGPGAIDERPSLRVGSWGLCWLALNPTKKGRSRQAGQARR